MTLGGHVKRLASLLGLSVGSLLVALLAVEVALRLAAPTSFVTQWERDLVLGWRGTPRLRGTLSSRFCTTEFLHNTDGFRDREHAVAKEPGVTRVLCIGDSFTWGWGVPEAAVYTRVLENLAGGDGLPTEVLNAGVGGYNTVQSLVYLRERGFAYAPDVVIHQATGNDLKVNASSKAEGAWQNPYAVLDDEGRAMVRGTPIGPLTGLGWLKYRLPRVSRLGFIVRERLDRHRIWRVRQRAGPAPAPRSELELPADETFVLFAALVRRMEEECAARGVRFVLLADFPLGPERAAYWKDGCGDIEAHFLAGYLARREEEAGAPAVIAGDGHWTEAAHRWVAEYLRSEVLAGG